MAIKGANCREGGWSQEGYKCTCTHIHTQPTLPREPPSVSIHWCQDLDVDLLEECVYLWYMCECTQTCGDTLDLKGLIVVLSWSQASFALPLKHYSTQACWDLHPDDIWNDTAGVCVCVFVWQREKEKEKTHQKTAVITLVCPYWFTINLVPSHFLSLVHEVCPSI